MKDIEKLLKRFMDGETSVEEETALTDFFRSATDEDRPANISGEDWETYRTMFRQFEEWETGEQESQMHIAETVNGQVAHAHGNKVAWLSAAAAVAATFVLAFLLNVGRNNRQVVAEATPSDTAKAIILPVDTFREGSGNNVPSSHSTQKAKPQKQRKLPYAPPVPRRLIAQATQTNGIGEDSMRVALEEAERLINAMTVYQEVRISEICNIEYEEEY